MFPNSQTSTRASINRQKHGIDTCFLFLNSKIVTTFRREGIALDANWRQTFKELVNFKIFGSLGVIFEEKLTFKSFKISGWEKR